MAHDIETRRQAIAYWNEGHSRKTTSLKFNVSESTLHLWRTQLKENGSLASKKQRIKWRKIDPVKFRRYVEDNPNAYLKNIASEFGVSVHAVEKALKRLGIER